MNQMVLKRRKQGAIVLLVATIAIWYVLWNATVARTLTVAFLDVGQGDSIFIESPAGAQLLIDGGANSAVIRELSKLVPFYDHSIDVVVATHPDQDHIGGLSDVFEKYDVDYFLEPGIANDTSAYTKLESLVSESLTTRILARRGMDIDLGAGANLQILFPDRDIASGDTNTASVVARLVYGEFEFLFTGDSPKSIERYLIALDRGQSTLQSDVLKVGHHGSKTSSSETFIETVSPDIAIISAGEGNRYGHPHEEVLNTLQEQNIDVRSTAEEGTVVFKL